MSSEDVAAKSSRLSNIADYFSTARHPVACMFHCGFKAASIFSFMFLNAMMGEEIITFIIVVLFAAFDFWTVKNITGRLLVNLRWQTMIDDFGNEKWVYESNESTRDLQAAAKAGDIDAKAELDKIKSDPGARTDSFIFWSMTYITPALWLLMLVMQIMTFKFFWVITAGICFTLSFTNA